MSEKTNEQEQGAEVSGRALQQFMDIYVLPEIGRRQELGLLDKPLNLRAAQIIFFPDRRTPEVRINSEVKAIGEVKLKDGVTKKPGEAVFESEREGLGKINLTDEDDPDCGHATMVKLGDFRYNKGLSREHIGRAEEFYAAAKFSLDKGNIAACFDNLYSAAELAAKAFLLTIPWDLITGFRSNIIDSQALGM